VTERTQTRSAHDLEEMGCEDHRWMEIDQDRVQWAGLFLGFLNLWSLLPLSQFYFFLSVLTIGKTLEMYELRLTISWATNQ
jgi:hypothetical protein